jgi:predicted nucleic acid-binding protein
MATGATRPGELFADASFVIALVNAHDQLHAAALTAASRVRNDGLLLVTTQAVLLEIGNALAKQRYRNDAVRLLTSLQSDPTVEIVPLSNALFERAFTLFREREDKEWGLIDCLSFVVMTDHGIREALSADEHFEQAGFIASLRRR